jgi:hypothetical protein
MSDSVLHVKNLNKVIDAFRKAPKLAAEKVEEAGIEIVEVLNRHNRYFHEWSHQKHNLQKDIGGKVEGNVITHGLGFYPSQTQITYQDGSKASYGNRLHEGFGTFGADPWIETGVEDNKKKMEKIYNKRMKELVEEI